MKPFYITYAADSDKDQTFFLWGLKQDILNRMLLPMGDITKAEARAWAAEHGFRKVATKRIVSVSVFARWTIGPF